jgi:hypothetical protein
MDPNELTCQKAEKLIPDKSEPWFRANKLFYTGDHWQDANGWSGPMLEHGHALYNQVLLEIQRAFVSKNTIAEVIERHKNAVIGREPAWSLTVRRALGDGEIPTAEEQALIDEAEALLKEWWDQRKAHKLIQEATATMLWSKRGQLRLFVPAVEVDDDGRVPSDDLQTSIGKIYLHRPDPDQATVYIDWNTMLEIGIYIYQKSEQQFAELTYLNGDQTVIQIIGMQAEDEDGEIPLFPVGLGGRLPVFEMNRNRLITDQVIQNQKLLNLALTMLQRNVIQGGFLERTFFNAQMPGEEIEDANAPGGKRFIPGPLHIGPGATNFLSGVVTEDLETGKQTVASPSVTYRDPVPVETFTQTKKAAYITILEEVDQLHAAIASDATASGESRKQARAEFEQSLNETKSEVERAIRWLLETVLAMAAVFSGQPGRFESLRAVADCRIDSGPISADEMRAQKELAEGKIISYKTAQANIGVDDPDAEQQQIDSEQEADSQRQQATLATAVLNAQRQLAGGQASNGLEQPEEGQKE